jgi:Tfp pilus assembly protein PilE
MVELLVVLAIIAVLATITVPTIDAMTSPKHALRQEGRKVMQLMTQARMTAMSRKVKMDLYLDPETREIGLIESRSFNLAGAEEPGPYLLSADTNRFEKRIILDEEFSLKAYPEEGVEDTEGMVYELAVSFLHFGGSDGGGITLVKDEMELSIKADVLTGRAKVVFPGEGDQENGRGGDL